MSTKSILIEKCSDSSLWYSTKIGVVFRVQYEEKECYWVRDHTDPDYAYLNWVHKKDAKAIQEAM